MYEELISRLLSLSEIDAIPQKSGICRITMECIGAIRELAIEAADAIDELKRDLDLAIRAEAAATEACKPRWIPVTERLPETARDVLVAFRLPKEKRYLITITQRASWSEKRKHDAFYQRGVTHWMEMPGPPKEET